GRSAAQTDLLHQADLGHRASRRRRREHRCSRPSERVLYHRRPGGRPGRRPEKREGVSMSTIKDGGTAFPVREPSGVHAMGLPAVKGITDTAERDRVYIEATTRAFIGMSLRDWFAGLAMQ